MEDWGTWHELQPRPAMQRSFWQPYEPNPGFDSGWWHHPTGAENSRFFTLSSPHGEVGRLQLRTEGYVVDWAQSSGLGRHAPEIALLEVHEAFRRSGVGRHLVAQACAAHAQERLFAKSDAAAFWLSIGWTQHVHPSEPEDHWTYYTQPHGWVT